MVVPTEGGTSRWRGGTAARGVRPPVEGGRSRRAARTAAATARRTGTNGSHLKSSQGRRWQGNVKQVGSSSQLERVGETLVDEGLAQLRGHFAQHNGAEEGIAVVREERIHLRIELRGTTVPQVGDVEEKEGTMERRRQVGGDEEVLQLGV
jgi:hypothetical protein